MRVKIGTPRDDEDLQIIRVDRRRPDLAGGGTRCIHHVEMKGTLDAPAHPLDAAEILKMALKRRVEKEVEEKLQEKVGEVLQ